MSGQHLIPSREQLGAVVQKTVGFLAYLHDAALIEGANAPCVPLSTIHYRKGNAIFRWAEWEQTMNPSSAPLGGPPTGVVAGGWVDWQALHLVLVDLEALRKQLIAHWGLSPLVGAKSVQPSWQATGKPGSGEKALFIHGEKDPSSGTPAHVCVEKPLDWPPPVPIDWRKQCRYVLKRIKKVMKAEGTTSAQPPSNPDGQPMGKPSAVTSGAAC